MKRLLSLLLMVFMLAPINDAMAQSNRRRSTTTRKTSTTRKPNTTRKSIGKGESPSTSTSLPQKPSKPVPHVFEGSLLYRKYEYNSAVVRRFSQGRAYNGERTILVTLKGNCVHIIDNDMHLHTVILGDQNMAYQYSDVTNEGISGKEDFINSYLSVMDPATGTAQLPKHFTIKSQDQPIDYKDQSCLAFRGELVSGSGASPSTADVEMWGSRMFLAPSAYKYVFDGLPTGEGIVVKGIFSQRGMIPILGKVVTTVAAELMAYKEYEVSPNDFQLPSGVRMVNYSKPSQLTKFYKSNTKALKKQGIYPMTVDKKEAQYNISSQWDFADEWIRKKTKIDYFDITWDVVGGVASSVVELIEQVTPKKTANDPIGSVDGADDPPTGDPRKDELFNSYKEEFMKYAKDVEKCATDMRKYGYNKQMKVIKVIKKQQERMKKIRNECHQKTGRYINTGLHWMSWKVPL